VRIWASGIEPRRGQLELDRQHHLAGDHQRAAGGQLVQRDRDRAADRVLQRHERRVGVAGPDRLERLGDAARGRTDAVLGGGMVRSACSVKVPSGPR
jgi:hypothetical protein